MVESFSGKVAFVTGGTGGLGRVVCSALRDRGATVAIVYLHEEGLSSLPKSLRSSDDKLLLLKADVTDEQQVRSAFDQAIARFGTVDYLLNIAGGYMTRTPIAELSPEDWDHMMNMNLRSAFLCSREALKIMLKKGSGRIINISAMAGLKPSGRRGAYAISKGGVATLTKICADEVKGSGVTVNAIAPAIIATEANLRSASGDEASAWVKPGEIAELMLYLCSDSGRAINGAVINIYGGI